VAGIFLQHHAATFTLSIVNGEVAHPRLSEDVSENHAASLALFNILLHSVPLNTFHYAKNIT
jgi:hypothetical protein